MSEITLPDFQFALADASEKSLRFICQDNSGTDFYVGSVFCLDKICSPEGVCVSQFETRGPSSGCWQVIFQNKHMPEQKMYLYLYSHRKPENKPRVYGRLSWHPDFCVKDAFF